MTRTALPFLLWLLWMDAKSNGFSHHKMKPLLKPLGVCWYLLWGIESFQGFLGGAKWICSIDSMVALKGNQKETANLGVQIPILTHTPF